MGVAGRGKVLHIWNTHRPYVQINQWRAQVLERGSCGLGSCFPLGFRLEKTGICATLHLAWTLNLDLGFARLQLAWTLYLDFATLQVTRCLFPLPSSSNLAISTSSNHNTWS